MGPQLSVPSAVWFHSSLFPRLYRPTALCAVSCMVSQLSVPTVPAGSPSRGGDITVYVPDKHQPSLPPPFFLFCSCVCFCLYSPFSCISFHKFSRQLSAFSLSSSGLIFALLVLSIIYLFMKVSQPRYNPLKRQLTNYTCHVREWGLVIVKGWLILCRLTCVRL